MEFIERYLDAIAVELPQEKQQDIIREIRANLLDVVDAAREEQGRELTDAELGQIIQQQGHPVDVAQRYAPDLPLVASEDMPLYRSVLWHSAAVVGVLVLLKGLTGLIHADSLNVLRLLISMAYNFLDQFATVLLLVTAIFYGAAHAGWTKVWRQRRWQATDLPKHPRARIRLSDCITDLTSSAFLLLLLWTPLWMSEAAQANLPVQFSADSEVWRYVLTVLAIGSLLFSGYRLTQMSWQRWAKYGYALEHLLFAIVFGLMSQQETLLVRVGEPSSQFDKLWLLANSSISSVLVVTALILAVLAVLEFKRARNL